MSVARDKNKAKILIYIPCHADYLMAFESAQKIQAEVAHMDSPFFEVAIHISINGVAFKVENEEKKGVSVSQTFSVLGGDVNIANGFLKALEIRPDYFWLLSANENLVDGVVGNLEKLIAANPLAGLLIANAENRIGELKLSNVFNDVPDNTALGLISGVIYKFSSTYESFRQSTVFCWTGWGQLAVLQDILSSDTKPIVVQFPDSCLYEKPYTFALDKSLNEMEIVGNVYAHSFFGMPLLAACLLIDEKKELRRFQRSWLKANWFKIAMFLQDATIGDELAYNRSKWIFSLTRRSYAPYSFTGIMFRASAKLPLYRFHQNRTARMMLDKYKRFMKSNG